MYTFYIKHTDHSHVLF